MPDYSPDRFVNREEAIDLVLSKVQNILAGRSERKRVIVFRGFRGAGKTWLLRHLAETELPKIAGVCPVYINLKEFSTKPRQDAVRDIIGRVLEAMQQRQDGELGKALHKPPALVPLDLLSDYLWFTLDDLSTIRILVLLVDFLYEAHPELLELLEKHVIGPLVANPRVLVVAAGRGQANPWQTPTVRFQVEDHKLKPFEADHTKDQLEKQRPGAASHANEIHEATLGYPLANVIIPYPLHKATAAQMRKLIDLLLEPIQNPDGSWPVERNYLEALCVLRAFDEERIPVLLDAYDPSLAPKRGWTPAETSEVLRRLIRTNLVRWASDLGGWWIVDQAIRHLLEEYLRVARPDRWKRCHEVAINLYRNWASRYPEEKGRWANEITYHESRLRGSASTP